MTETPPETMIDKNNKDNINNIKNNKQYKNDNARNNTLNTHHNDSNSNRYDASDDDNHTHKEKNKNKGYRNNSATIDNKMYHDNGYLLNNITKANHNGTSSANNIPNNIKDNNNISTTKRF